jgi:hypothetical protein
MRQNFSRAAQIFFSPATFVPFLFGSTFLSVLGSAITQAGLFHSKNRLQLFEAKPTTTLCLSHVVKT